MIATVAGTAIRPGVSKNGRLYTPEAIGRMVDRAHTRITSGGMPLTMLTHHEAGDDSTRIVGRITGITQEADGSARYTAVLTDTSHGRDIHTLISGPDPALQGVSIRGAWLGRVRREQHDGRTVETADDLELDGLDYTRKPGVDGAGIDNVQPATAEPRESDGATRVPITEAAPEATVTITEADDAPQVSYADPGYRPDQAKRLPLGSRGQAKAAWLHLAEADHARTYTAAQLKRVRGRIKKALGQHGVAVTAEGWLVDRATEVTETLAECWDDMPAGSVYLSLTNGPTTVTVSSAVLDPHDLDIVGRAAMAGACNALTAFDPDLDADIDLPGAPAEDDDDDMETAPSAAEAAESAAATETTATLAPVEPAEGTATTPTPQTPAPDAPAAGTPEPEEEPAMADTTPEAAVQAAAVPAAGGITLTNDQFAQLLATFAPRPASPVEAAPAEAAPVAEAAETAPAEVAESDDERIARLVAEGIAKALPQAIQENVEQNGPPARKGLVAQVSESAPTGAAASGLNAYGVPSDWPDKPLHQYTDEERDRYFGGAVEQHVLGQRTRG